MNPSKEEAARQLFVRQKGYAILPPRKDRSLIPQQPVKRINISAVLIYLFHFTYNYKKTMEKITFSIVFRHSLRYKVRQQPHV